MGNYKFRLSDMMPNAWFYKLRDMNKTRNHSLSHHPIKKKLPIPSPNATKSQKPYFPQPTTPFYYYHIPEPTKPYNFHNSPTNQKFSDTQFPDFPRKSSSTKKRNSRRKTIYKPSPRLVNSSASPDLFSSAESSPEFEPKNSCDSLSSNGSQPSWSTSCNCRITSSTTDIIIDMDEESFSRKIEEEIEVFDEMPQLQQLPPILTKPKAVSGSSELFDQDPIKIVKEDWNKTQKETKTSPRVRKSVSNSAGVRLRGNSPRIASKKLSQACGRRSGGSKPPQRRSFSASLAIVKSSLDPQRDFRESMVEMIVENNIRASKDLEELLACYLSLNSDEYHDLIVKAFQQIWLDMAHLKL